MKHIKHLLFCSILLLSISSYAKTFHVSPNGNLGNSKQQSMTLNHALNLASNGDTISLLPGNYILPTRTITSSVTIQNDNSSEGTVTITPKQENTRLFTVTSADVTLTLKGLYLIGNGTVNYGGLIRCDSGTIVIQNSTLADATAEYGGAIAIYSDGTLNITNSTITNNTATNGFPTSKGGGIYISSGENSLTMNGVTVAYNTGDEGTQIAVEDSSASIDIKNSIIVDSDTSKTAFENHNGSCIYTIVSKASTPLTGSGSWNYDTDAEAYAKVGTGETGDLNLATELADNGGPTPTLKVNSGSIANSIIYDTGLTGNTLFQAGSSENEKFGYNISFNYDKSVMVVTAPPAGKAYVYKKVEGNWQVYSTLNVDSAGSEDLTIAFSHNSKIAIGNHVMNKVNIFKDNGTSYENYGQALSGDINDMSFGYSVSFSPNDLIAIGDPNSMNLMGSMVGKVYIYRDNGDNFENTSNSLEGRADGGSYGITVEWNTENILAIGNPGSSSIYLYKDTGASRLYQYGSTLTGETGFGNYLKFSPDGKLSASNLLENNGTVRIYQNTGSTYTQLGATLEGTERYSDFGAELSFSNTGSTLAVGAKREDSNKGAIYIFKLNESGEFQEYGQKITQDEQSGTVYLGYKIVFNESNLIAASATGINSVFIYKDTGSEYMQYGSKLNNPESTGGYGISTAFDAESTLFIGAPDIDSNTGKVYKSAISIFNSSPSTDQREFIRTTSESETRTIGAYEINTVSNMLKRLRLI